MATRSDSQDVSPLSRPQGADENTPLLGTTDSSATTNHLTVPRTGRGRRDSDDSDEVDEIDPNEFDLLLARSVPTSGGFLEPESTENPLLRGARRYSSVSRQRAGATTSHSQSQSQSRKSPRPSIVDHVANGADDQDGPSSPYLDAEDDDGDPLLPNSHDDAKASPYLNGVSTRRFWCIFSMILTLNFIACFDGTIMASSHPVITSYFNASNSASWLSTAFLLTSTSFQPLLGRISDSVGRKPPYLITMFIFAMANVWCATATSMTSFIFARAACGLGAGGMMTLGSIIISDMVTIEARGEYQSYLNITYGIGSALGAALGGAMADHLGWRWEFGIQVLPILVCVLVAFLAVPHDLGIVGKRETFLEALQAFDSRGSLLLTMSITSLVLGLNLGGNVLPWSHPFVMAALVTFSVAFPTFLYSHLGMVLGIAASSLVMQNALVVYLDRHVAGPAKADIIARVRESVETVAALEGPAREQVVLSYEAALRLTFLCCVAVAFVSWCLIVPVKLPRLGQRK
ncbi:Peptidyl-prolyl cis-trans isomerase-like 1 [Verticillium dahliae VDG1]|nr:Peptidyl-prolyl cis-trans isomerase-like 1 [Verticillium dahliae VDG1]